MRNIINALAIAFLVFIFTFYVDGEMGVILIAFLLAAPLFSLFFALYSRKRVHVRFDCDAYVKKGTELTVNVKVEKEGKFPLSFIEIKFAASPGFRQNDKTYRLSILTESETEFTISFPAEIGGNAEISVESVYACGFLGFMKFRAKTPLPEPKGIGIIPDTPEITASSQLFRSIADSVLTSDNDEDNDTVMLFAANTFPGYEHREYVQGDPIKRINWKLSSKKSKLMVRLDEAASAVQPCLVLDLFRSSSAETLSSLKKEEKLLQAVFGLITLLINQGIACTFVYRNYNGDIATENVDNPDYPMQLLLKVLSVKSVPEQRVDISLIDGSCCTYIIATTDLSDCFAQIEGALPDKENSCVMIPDVSCHSGTNLQAWYLTEDNNFKLV